LGEGGEMMDKYGCPACYEDEVVGKRLSPKFCDTFKVLDHERLGRIIRCANCEENFVLLKNGSMRIDMEELETTELIECTEDSCKDTWIKSIYREEHPCYSCDTYRQITSKEEKEEIVTKIPVISTNLYSRKIRVRK
jgi:hypothetical protein